MLIAEWPVHKHPVDPINYLVATKHLQCHAVKLGDEDNDSDHDYESDYDVMSQHEFEVTSAFRGVDSPSLP